MTKPDDYKALELFFPDNHICDFLEMVREKLREQNSREQNFARFCFRMSHFGLAEKVNAMGDILPHMPTFSTDFRALFIIAEEVLEILQLDPGDDTSSIPHYAELVALRK